jgi:hypothetical protein
MGRAGAYASAIGPLAAVLGTHVVGCTSRRGVYFAHGALMEGAVYRIRTDYHFSNTLGIVRLVVSIVITDSTAKAIPLPKLAWRWRLGGPRSP